jgi:hypothetical protein
VFIDLRCEGYRACNEIGGEDVATVSTVSIYIALTFVRLDEQQ